MTTAEVVRRGATNSLDIPYRFNPLFGAGDEIADSQATRPLNDYLKRPTPGINSSVTSNLNREENFYGK